MRVSGCIDRILEIMILYGGDYLLKEKNYQGVTPYDVLKNKKKR